MPVERVLSTDQHVLARASPSVEPRARPGWHEKAIDHSYRFAEGISTLTRAADQPGGLPGVSRHKTCNTHLPGGFPLRCFQRLSLPHLATQRWTERSSWHTRGESLPILSY